MQRWRRLLERLREQDPSPWFDFRLSLGNILGGSDPLPQQTDRWSAEKMLKEALLPLKEAEHSAEAIDLCESVLTGRWSGDEASVEQRYRSYQQTLIRFLPALLLQVDASGRLSDRIFRRAAELVPQLLNVICYSGPPVRWLERELDSRQAARLQAFTRRLVDTIAAQPLDEKSAELLVAASQGYSNVVGAHLEGAHFILPAARAHIAHGLDRLQIANSYRRGPVYRAVLEMARGAAPQAEEELPALAEELKTFPSETLQALLPVAHPALRTVLLTALDWEESAPLVALLGPGSATPYDQIQSVGNSPEPDNGVVDVAAAQTALAQVSEQRVQQLFALFRQARSGLGSEIYLLEALRGLNREEIVTRKDRRHQLSVKAFGLLPLEQGAEEVTARYLWLKQFEKESRRYGAQRQASEGAAVQVALQNLAQIAGCGDVHRLEWQMEVRLGAEELAPGRTWEVEPYKVVLELEGDRPALVVWRGERRLKSVPRPVRQHPEYETMKATVQALREQATRIRRVLEEWMASGEQLAVDDLETLVRLPVARQFLSSLILRTGGGAFGLLDPDTGQLRDLESRTLDPDPPLLIAHPYHLDTAGLLGVWQRALVRQRVVQPFRQAFRELYLLTPAERETVTHSNRFANQQVDAARAYRLFQSRGWRLPHDEGVVPVRVFSEHGLRACFAFTDVGHYFSETDSVNSNAIYFEPHAIHAGHAPGPERDRIPLAEIPPLIFSEVMRDADLVVSVAQWTAEAAAHAARRAAERAQRWAEEAAALRRRSEEAYRRQAEVVELLLEDLGVEGVELEGHYALVQGTLARYRIHLGSGSIHIEPGGYLCIVPDTSVRPPERLFLPFADDGNQQLSIVISKILLLLNDAALEDPTILRQIKRGHL